MENNVIYRIDDLAPIGCDDCKGCHSCCVMMGDTIIQDPYDYWLFSRNMKIAGGGKITFEMLVSEDGPWELNKADNLLLPNIKMVEGGKCPFLDKSGRCSIHMIRSGLCRLFPLARVFNEDGSMGYFVLKGKMGCHKRDRNVKQRDVSIKGWLGYAFPDKYEMFQSRWHKVKKQASGVAGTLSDDDLSGYLSEFLGRFYSEEYGDDFFSEFEKRASLFLTQ